MRLIAGYIPFAALCLGAFLGGLIAVIIGIPQWTLAIPGGLIGGYFLSRLLLRRTYAPDDSSEAN
ncbi:MAG: hypothetical protein JO246_16235 [Frankiaceae bacterium]|nr:hypothetical protein [Frankiaceae bacterium]MBV9870123.1 hypothetical protein [Frankiaceae bacterium]